MRLLSSLCSLVLVPLMVCAFGPLATACVDSPLPELEPPARLIVAWDPLGCGEPHRVVVELEDEQGADVARSAPCELGGVTLDMPHWGVFRGRVYAWSLEPNADAEIRSVTSVRLDIDAPVVHWYVETPR